MARKYRITETDLKRMINDAVRRILSEGTSDRVFHYIMLDYLCEMIKTGNLHMSSAEEENTGGKKFMSLTRNRSNQQGFQYGTYTASEYSSKQNYARIEFDGRALQNIRNSKIKPYDYLYNEPTYDEHDRMNGKQMHMKDDYEYDPTDAYGKERQFYSQAEDRLLTDNEDIPNAYKYITIIDVMLRNPEGNDAKRLKQLLQEKPMWKDKIRIHTEDKRFNRPTIK